MKLLDKVLRYWRVNVALVNCPRKMDSVFDIGCGEGYLINKLRNQVKKRDGVDPRLRADTVSPGSELKKGLFPSAIEEYQMRHSYDAIFALAVFEHFTEDDIKQSASVIFQMLAPGGRLIITVPHPFVDKILDVLLFFHLIEAHSIEEHHGFEPDELLVYFSETLRLVKRGRFQFGLNNLFVFERI